MSQLDVFAEAKVRFNSGDQSERYLNRDAR